jgi:hypothetical protein
MDAIDDFRQRLRQAGISDDKPLAAILLTAFQTAETARSAVQDGARGLTPEGETDLIKRVVQAIGQQAKTSLEQHRLRLDRKLSLVAGGIVAAGLLVAGIGGYWAGWSAGAQASRVIENEVAAAALASGPEAASGWAMLMRSNDIAKAMAQCSGAGVWTDNGRRACAVPLWIDGPELPPTTKR